MLTGLQFICIYLLLFQFKSLYQLAWDAFSKTTAQQQLGWRHEKWERTALQSLRLVQKEGRRCSKHRAEVPHSSGDAHGGAGCPSAVHGQYMKQISTCSHGGAYRAAEDVAWKRHSPCIPLQEQPQARAAARGEQPAVGQEGWGSCACGDLCGAVPEGWALRYRAVLERCLESTVGRPSSISLGRTASHVE